jgi:hypothetical protein
MCPGGFFAVEGVVAKAAMQDADESITQGAQGLVVAVSGGAVRSTRSALPMLPLVGF